MNARAEYMGRVLRCKRCGHAFRWLGDGEDAARAAEEARVLQADARVSERVELQRRLRMLELELAEARLRTDEEAERADGFRAGRDSLATDHDALHGVIKSLEQDLAAVTGQRDEAARALELLRAERDAATREARMHEGGLRAVEDRLAEVQTSLQLETARAFRLQAELASVQEAAMAELAFGVHDRARV
jgi:chromosome segregation ATPase